MTSLVLTHRPPLPLTGGASLRNWQNIRVLASFGPTDVVSVGSGTAAAPLDHVREWASFDLVERTRWDRIKTACAPLRPGVYPGVDLLHLGGVVSWLRRRSATRRYDVAVIETIAMSGYTDDVRPIADRVVFDAHNVEAVLQPTLDAAAAASATGIAGQMNRMKRWILQRRITAAERRAVTRADLVWACSELDARELSRKYRRQLITVVPNGVDVDAYRQVDSTTIEADWTGRPVTMVYPGLFSYPPNEDAAMRLIKEVLPAVRARGHRARVVVVGRNPSDAMRAAAAEDADVVVTGEVESLLPFLAPPCVVTLPIHAGGGTRLKIAEAFAAGRPVVSTEKGAEGLDAASGVHLLIRNDAGDIAAAVIELWQRPALRRRVCEAAFELVQERYSWSVARERIAASLGLRAERLAGEAGV